MQNAKLNPSNSTEVQQLTSQLNNMNSKLSQTKEEANQTKNQIVEAFNQKASILNFNSSLDGVKEKIEGVASKIDKFKNRVTKLITAVAIFNLIRSGLTSLRNYFLSLLKTDDSFNSSLNQIKANLMTAFAPIYNTILPAINSLMNALSQVTGTIATFISSLFGLSTSDAKKQAQGLTKALDDTKKSADDASGSLASFDKLEVIGNDSSNSDGTSSTPSIDYSGEIETNSKLLDLLNKLKESLNTIDFTNLLNALSNLKNALSFLWSGVVDLAKDFYNNFLLPLTKYVIENTLPDFLNATADAIMKIDFSKIRGAFNELYESLLPFTMTLFDSLEWFYENILIPLGLWAINDVLPAFLHILSGALDVVNQACSDLQPIWQWFWDNVLSPIASFSGGVIVDVLNGLGDALKWIADNEVAMSIIEGIAIAIGLVSAALAIYNIAMGVCKIVTRAFATIIGFLTSPITLVVLAIGALIAIIILCIKHWDEIKETVSNVVEDIKEKVSSAFEIVKETISNAIDKIKEILDKVISFIKDNWQSLLLLIVNPFAGAFKLLYDNCDGFREFVDNFISKVKETISNGFNDVKNTITNVINTVKSGVTNGFNTIKSSISNVMNSVKSTISNVWNSIWSTIKGVINNIINGVETMINTIIRGLNKILTPLTEVGNKILSAVGIKSFSFSALSTVSLPRLASGTVIPPRQEFAAVLGDQKHGTNIEAPLETIKQADREVLEEFMTKLNGLNDKIQEIVLKNLTFIFQMGGTSFQKMVIDAVRLTEKEMGKPLFVS